MKLTIIGGGLAGSEAAWQAAKRGVEVTLLEMRPHKQTPAHQTGGLAELVCSNSFRAAALTNAVGLLKEEMRRFDSLIMAVADATSVPAGGALAVDRTLFSRYVEQKLMATGRVELRREEVQAIPSEDAVIVATGPLTDGALAAEIRAMCGGELHFYDAVAPIVSGDSINREVAFYASRYDKGDADYLNCPLNEEEYQRFYDALHTAQVYPGHDFEKPNYFEGCMPIEEMAARGRDTMAFGPLKPVGLQDPRTGARPYAVVQLRREDAAGSRFNMVGFQTHLLRGEQDRVFRMIPGLEQAEFERYGMIHRNTYICSPCRLTINLSWKERPGLFFAGQITGVEGYLESAAMGLLAGVNGARFVRGASLFSFPPETAIGALATHVACGDSHHFEPVNVSFGLFTPLNQRVRSKRAKQEALAQRALAAMDELVLSESATMVPEIQMEK